MNQINVINYIMNRFNDYNIELIPVLITILDTLSVTTTAKKLGVTQSAVSHSLKKLRTQFKDELVVREGNRLTPTLKAQAIYPSLKKWLGELETIVDATEFDPLTSQKIFYISATDIVETMYMPSIIRYLVQHAPHMSIRLTRWHNDTVHNQLDRLEANLGIGVTPPATPNIYQSVLYKDSFISAARKDHPFFDSKQTLDDFLSFPHTMTSGGDRFKGVVDRALQRIGRVRTLTHTVPNFASGPLIIKNSDCILTAPQRFMELKAEDQGIRLFKAPLNLPTFEVKLFWSRKTHKDPAHKWMRNALKSLIQVADKTAS